MSQPADFNKSTASIVDASENFISENISCDACSLRFVSPICDPVSVPGVVRLVSPVSEGYLVPPPSCGPSVAPLPPAGLDRVGFYSGGVDFSCSLASSRSSVGVSSAAVCVLFPEVGSELPGARSVSGVAASGLVCSGPSPGGVGLAVAAPVVPCRASVVAGLVELEEGEIPVGGVGAGRVRSLGSQPPGLAPLRVVSVAVVPGGAVPPVVVPGGSAPLFAGVAALGSGSGDAVQACPFPPGLVQPSPRQATYDGWTPLHLAVQSHRTDIIRLLLIKGADKSLKNRLPKLAGHSDYGTNMLCKKESAICGQGRLFCMCLSAKD
ncbi:hypothetical protein OROGR_001602 [Orobanche gracilis]